MVATSSVMVASSLLMVATSLVIVAPSLVMVAPSLVMEETSLVMVATTMFLFDGSEARTQWKIQKSVTGVQLLSCSAQQLSQTDRGMC